MNSVITPLFSTPLYSTKINVLDCPDFESIDWVTTHGHGMSRDSRLLDQPEWESLRSQILYHIEQFFYKELKANTNCKIHITTSVANKNEPTQIHPRHSHVNSILSGCVYFDFHPSQIKFIRRYYNQIKYDVTDYNLYNSEAWVVSPEPGLLLIWPSELEHEVEISKIDNPIRYSIAFNTWLSGDVNTAELALLRL